MGHFVTLPPNTFDSSVIGCFDYDPFASFLQFPVYMVRQNSDQLIAKAYEILESGATGPMMVEIEPELIAPRTIYRGWLGEIG